MADEFQQFYDITEYTNSMGQPESILRNSIPLQIISGKIELGEIPDMFYKIQIPNMVERHISSTINDASQFKCDYDNAIIYFDSSLEGQFVNVTFYALGKLRHLAKSTMVEDVNNNFNSDNVEEVLNEIDTRFDNTLGQLNFMIIDCGYFTDTIEGLSFDGGEF